MHAVVTRSPPSWLVVARSSARSRVITPITSENGKTKDLAQIMKAFETENQRTVIIMKDDDAMLRRAARNIPYLHVLCYDKLSAKELLYGRKILVLETAAENLGKFYGER